MYLPTDETFVPHSFQTKKSWLNWTTGLNKLTKIKVIHGLPTWHLDFQSILWNSWIFHIVVIQSLLLEIMIFMQIRKETIKMMVIIKPPVMTIFKIFIIIFTRLAVKPNLSSAIGLVEVSLETLLPQYFESLVIIIFRNSKFFQNKNFKN